MAQENENTFAPEMLEVMEGLLKMCVDREKQITDLNRVVEGLQAKLASNPESKPATEPSGTNSVISENSIVIVDESIPFQKKLIMLLADHGFDVVGTTTEHSAALKLVQSLNPVLVMIDFSLPNMEGLMASKQIKADCPETKVIIMSEQLEEHTVLQAIQYGADEYIPKPVQPVRLIQVIKNLLTA